MYVCNSLDEASNACMEWVVLQDYQSVVTFSQADAYLIGGWLISFFGLCCAYVVIAKAIKLA
jgi:hypothetical protein